MGEFSMCDFVSDAQHANCNASAVPNSRAGVEADEPVGYERVPGEALVNGCIERYEGFLRRGDHIAA